MSIKSLLDNDWYNFTMSAVIRKNWPDRIVGYEFINRDKGFQVADYVDLDVLKEEIDSLRELTFSVSELNYLLDLGVFTEEDVFSWGAMDLPEVEIEKCNGQLVVSAEGPWWIATFLETPILSIITELVSNSYPLTTSQARANGHKYMDKVIQGLRTHPGIQFSQFGSRRRYSQEWEHELTEFLVKNAPKNMIGISNVALAREFDWSLSGTIAHQYDMVLAAKEIASHDGNSPCYPLVEAQEVGIKAWEESYAGKWAGGMLCMIPDTFGTDWFLQNMTEERLWRWHTFKQDSGVPKVFAEKVMARLLELGFEPKHFRINHTDCLDLDKMIDLYNWCDERYKIGFGWGTKLTNNVGVPTHSFVWKPYETGTWDNEDFIMCVKLSDNLSKATGDPEMIEMVKGLAGYTNIYNQGQDA